MSGKDSSPPIGQNCAAGSEPVPQWWLILWIGWGAIMATLVGWMDRNLLAASAWLVAGALIGRFSVPLLSPLADPIFDWYRALVNDGEREQRMIVLEMNGETDSVEFKRLIDDCSFSALLAVPPVIGLLHGILAGGVGGALSALDSNVALPAWQTALIGIVVGPLFVSLLYAVVLSLIAPVGRDLQLTTTLARRALLFVSPLFAFPVAWHCFRSLRTRQRA